MKVKLHNMNGGVFGVVGPQVPFELDDAGQANTAIHVTLSDGTHFHFPPGGEQSTVLPPGDFTVVVIVASFSHGAFGRTYKSTLKIGGRKAASATGTLPDGSEGESDFQAFVLRVS